MTEHIILPMVRCHSGKFGLNLGAHIFNIEADNEMTPLQPGWYILLQGGQSYNLDTPTGPLPTRRDAIMVWVDQLQ